MDDENNLKTNSQPSVNDVASPTADSANKPVNSSPLPTEMPERPAVGQSPIIGKKQAKAPKKKLLMILALIVLIGGGAAAYVLLTRDNDSNQTAAVETVDVEVLRIGTNDGPANNMFPKNGLGVTYEQNRQIYEGLVGNKDKSYVPLLASSWTNPDEKTWVFKLKPDVKFHTGKTMTATDVKRSLEALKSLDHLAFVVSTLASVEATSDLEVTITTTEPDALLLNRLALAYITDQDAPTAEAANGTGAYKLDTSATYDENNATFIANDDYHAGRPKTRKIVYKIYGADTELNEALKKGEVDMIQTIPDEAATEGLTAAGFAKIDTEAPGTFGVYINMLREDSPLQKKEVRHALSLAMDRESLVEELDNDNSPAYQVIPKSLPGYDAGLSFPKFNLEAAKKALADAGYPNGVTLEYVYISEVQPDPPIILKQLEAAGFKIEAKAFDEVDSALDAVFGGEFDIFTASYISDLADSRDLLGALLESTEEAYPIHKDPAFDKLLADSDKEFDPTKRIAILKEANKYITDNYLWVPLRSAVYVTYYRSDLDITVDYDATGSPGAYYWKVGRKVTN